MDYGAIGAWGDFILNPMIEEPDSDIDVAIKYSDHGDDYIVIKTIHEDYYEYGYYINRKDYNIGDECFIRNPVNFFKDDIYNIDNLYMSYSSYLYRRIKEIFTNEKTFGARVSYCPQHDFDRFIEYDLKKVIDSGCRFDHSDEKQTIILFLVKNGIATEENLNRLENLKLDSRKDGFDGVCGKTKTNDFVCGDTIEWIYAHGKILDDKDVEVDYDDYDAWGIATFSLELSQFDQLRIDI